MVTTAFFGILSLFSKYGIHFGENFQCKCWGSLIYADFSLQMKNLRPWSKSNSYIARKVCSLGLCSALAIFSYICLHHGLSIIWKDFLGMEEQSVHIFILIFIFSSFVLPFLFHDYTPKSLFMVNHGFKLCMMVVLANLCCWKKLWALIEGVTCSKTSIA